PTVLDKVLEVMVVFADRSKPMTIFGCTISTVGHIADLKKALSEVSGVPAKRMVVSAVSRVVRFCCDVCRVALPDAVQPHVQFADVYNSRIYRFLEDDFGLSEIRPRSARRAPDRSCCCCAVTRQ